MQICNISPIAMDLSVSVCLSVTFLRTGHTLVKIKKMTFFILTFAIVIPSIKIPASDWLKRGLHNPMFTSICL